MFFWGNLLIKKEIPFSKQIGSMDHLQKKLLEAQLKLRKKEVYQAEAKKVKERLDNALKEVENLEEEFEELEMAEHDVGKATAEFDRIRKEMAKSESCIFNGSL